jgi:hypothetical protein
MRTYRDLIREFADTLRRENAEAQEQIDQIKTGWRIHDNPFGGGRSDVTEQEIELLKRDISSREQALAWIEDDLQRLETI